MKIFISWSGNSSRMVAEALSDWLQRSIQAVKPFYSPDIDKGAKWSNEIDAALEGTRFGIVCLTPDNLSSDWIHYEAGALSKTKDASIWTFLIDLKPSDVKQPLGRFQHTLFEKADVLKMLKSINAKLSEVGGESLKDGLLEEIFNESWTKLETRINEAKKSIVKQSDNEIVLPTENARSDNDKLDEVLEILRNQQRFNSSNTSKSLRSKYNALSQNKFDELTIEIIRLDEKVSPIDYLMKLSDAMPLGTNLALAGDSSQGTLKFRIEPDFRIDEDALTNLIIEACEKLKFPLKSISVTDTRGQTRDIEIW